ncbi:MAG: DUF1646 family protein [Planctomycetota bacterium]
MRNVIFCLLILFFCVFSGILFAESSPAHPSWTPEMQKLMWALIGSLVLMILGPMLIHIIDEQLGYFFFLLGCLILFYALSLGIVRYEHGYFFQEKMPHGPTFKSQLTELADFDTTFMTKVASLQGKALEDTLNKYFKLLPSPEQEKFLAEVKNWLGTSNVFLKETKISLLDDNQKNANGEKVFKALLYSMEVKQFEEFLNHCLHNSSEKNQKEMVSALKQLLGANGLKEIVDEAHHSLQIQLTPSATFTYQENALELKLTQAYVTHSFTEGHPHHLLELLQEPLMLLICFFSLSMLSVIFQSNIRNMFTQLATKVKPEIIIFFFVFFVGGMGAISVVVMAALGGIFFSTLSKVMKKDYTIPVVCFSANIGISALLTTVGEPLSLFVVRNLGEGTVYLLKTFSVSVFLNSLLLAIISYSFAKKAPILPKTKEEIMLEDVNLAKKAEKKAKKEIGEAKVAEAEILKTVKKSKEAGPGLQKAVESYDKETKEAIEAAENFEKAGDEVFTAVESFEEEQHNLSHELDRILHATVKLAFFVWGLIFFGEGVKPVASELIAQFSTLTLFFANIISAVADNALLGLLEIQAGMSQLTVFILTISLAFWGVGLVPGNVCNIVLKEALHIQFGTWAKYGFPVAIVLCIFNLLLVFLASNFPILIFPFGS